jgi:hypothetical protein
MLPPTKPTNTENETHMLNEDSFYINNRGTTMKYFSIQSPDKDWEYF